VVFTKMREGRGSFRERRIWKRRNRLKEEENTQSQKDMLGWLGVVFVFGGFLCGVGGGWVFWVCWFC